MFKKVTPEQAGISSENVIKFIKKLEKNGASMHGIIFVKGEDVFAEAYWKPFHQNFHHRMYSQTKSFVSIAIGLLLEEGKLDLYDRIVDYFPEKIDGKVHENLKNQTIREMLMMTTVGGPSSWFISEDIDRTHLYLNRERQMRRSNTIWEYDSNGAQVLCALVEKLSGKTLLEYLREKLFNKMDAFSTAEILKTKNNDSWGDSAMICTLRDMVKFGRLVMNYGTWKGERLMGEKYLREATSKLTDCQTSAIYSSSGEGYGYQIWRVCGNGFAFIGMGDQITVCYPDKDLIFACYCDNQGNPHTTQLIFSELEDLFVDQIQDSPLPENSKKVKELEELIAKLELRALKGKKDSPLKDRINGKQFVCEENSTGITKFTFIFNDDCTGEFRYTNAQGDKVLPFGINHNVFGKFPQLGYSNEHGGVTTTDGFMYNDAVSMKWLGDNSLLLYVQIIDKYFGNMFIRFGYNDKDGFVEMGKTAENFLNEYVGRFCVKELEDIK